MAVYLHLGPFSKSVISEIDRRIAELDGMRPVKLSITHNYSSDRGAQRDVGEA